jgi:hypothetical protein
LSTAPLRIDWDLSRVKPAQFSFEWLIQPSTKSTDIKAEPRIRQLSSSTIGAIEGTSFSFLAGTSTEQLPTADYLDEQITDLYNLANDGLIEDEQIRTFWETLSTLLRTFGDTAIVGIAPYIIGEKASSESASETLKCLSHHESRVAYTYRVWITERALQSPSSWIRDAAASALESMDDPSAIPYLREALSKESNASLRQYFQAVIGYLSRKR